MVKEITGNKNGNKAATDRQHSFPVDAGGTVAAGWANPNGIEAISPGLRGTSYPGSQNPQKPTTLKGEWRLHKAESP